MVVKPVKLRKNKLSIMKRKFLFKMATYLSDFVLKSSIVTIISIKNGMRMMDTIIADREVRYALTSNLLRKAESS